MKNSKLIEIVEQHDDIIRTPTKLYCSKSTYGYINGITQIIDSYCETSLDEYTQHYISDEYKNHKASGMRIYPIRFPGYTLGGLFLNKDNVITKITINLDYFEKDYNKEEIIEYLQCFIGDTIIFKESR